MNDLEPAKLVFLAFLGSLSLLAVVLWAALLITAVILAIRWKPFRRNQTLRKAVSMTWLLIKATVVAVAYALGGAIGGLMTGVPIVAGILAVVAAGAGFLQVLIGDFTTSSKTSSYAGADVLANGYTRSDYYAQGLTDTELDAFDFDTDANAPPPETAGFAISEWVSDNM